jgi:hypothetical protein
MLSLMNVYLTLFNDAPSQLDYNGFPWLRWSKYYNQIDYSSMYCSTSKFALHQQNYLWSGVLENRLGWRWLRWCTTSSVSKTIRGTGWANSTRIRLSLPNALQAGYCRLLQTAQKTVTNCTCNCSNNRYITEIYEILLDSRYNYLNRKVID